MSVSEISPPSLAPATTMAAPLLATGPRDGTFKRATDLVIGSLLALLAAPIILITMVLVRLTSKGPSIYTQVRLGRGNCSYTIYKIRTMYENCEATSGPRWSTKGDTRVTPVGRVLRSTHLDELPQLWNVLRGEMSLVGPRPERPIFVDRFRETVPDYDLRHAVPGGMTGWAQVHGWRGNSSLRKRVQYDLYYITHWTPLLDLRILWMTVWHGFIHRNAY
jgi:undecaprenyl-phosphate glucose phosphotransferase